MHTVTALAARPAPQPFSGNTEICAGQVPLPIGGLPPIRQLKPTPEPDISLKQRSGQFAQVMAEVLSGLRPARQVSSWLSPAVYDQLQLQLKRQRTPTQQHTKVASVHVDLVTNSAAEIVARLSTTQRSRALAMRLEKTADIRGLSKWHCTALCWA